MSTKILCPGCGKEFQPYKDKCPHCGQENLMFLTKVGKEEYQKSIESQKPPAPRPGPNPSKPGPSKTYSGPRASKPLPKARVFAGGGCMWILRENGKLYKLDNSDAQARKVLEDNIDCSAAAGSDSFFYRTKEGKQKFWRNGTVSSWDEDGLQPSALYAGEDFALLLTQSGELYRFDQEVRRRIAAGVRSAAAGKTCAVYVTKDGVVQSFGRDGNFSGIHDAQAVYADGCSDTFWIRTDNELFLWGDGSRNRQSDLCVLYTFSGTGSEDPDCRVYEYGGYDENNPEHKELYHRLEKQCGGSLSVNRYGGPDYNQELPHVYGACYTYSFEDRIEKVGPIKWLDEPAKIDCGLWFGRYGLLVESVEFRQAEVKKAVRLRDGWGVLVEDGTLSLIIGGKKQSTMQDVFDIAVSMQGTVVLSQKDGKVLYGPAETILKGRPLRNVSI